MLQTVLQVRGMSCEMCEAHVNETVRATFPEVKSVKSSHKKGTTTILSDAVLDIDTLKRAIGKTGYDVLSGVSEPYVKKGFFEKLTGFFK
ncbi:MAG: heavy metal-associated domain-containing protein [Sutterellaceae bacterium]|nr:heavy metal-associated domain-containing protein [Sutterellaceae bacterium]